MANLAKQKIKNIDTLFTHCSAFERYTNIGDLLIEIDRMHKEKGFSMLGYHFVLGKDGEVGIGRMLNEIPAAQKPLNTNTVTVCVHGLHINKFTQDQMRAYETLAYEMQDMLQTVKEDKNFRLRVRGHKEIANKECPVFDWVKVLNLKQVNGVYVLPRTKYNWWTKFLIKYKTYTIVEHK